MTRMLIEIAACLLAAGALGLLAGWMIGRASSRRRQRAIRAEWQRRYSELELRSGRDIDQLETQVEELGGEIQKLTRSNRSLDESLKKTEAGIHQARAEAIELNQQQATTQERLQKLLKQKDDEIAALLNGESAARSMAAASAVAGVSTLARERVASLQGGKDTLAADARAARQASATLQRERLRVEADSDALDNDELEQQTVAIDRADLPSDLFDATIQMDPASLPGPAPDIDTAASPAAGATTSPAGSAVTATARPDAGDTMIDATVALDADDDDNDSTMLIEPPFDDFAGGRPARAGDDDTETATADLDDDGDEDTRHR